MVQIDGFTQTLMVVCFVVAILAVLMSSQSKGRKIRDVLIFGFLAIFIPSVCIKMHQAEYTDFYNWLISDYNANYLVGYIYNMVLILALVLALFVLIRTVCGLVMKHINKEVDIQSIDASDIVLYLYHPVTRVCSIYTIDKQLIPDDVILKSTGKLDVYSDADNLRSVYETFECANKEDNDRLFYAHKLFFEKQVTDDD